MLITDLAGEILDMSYVTVAEFKMNEICLMVT